MRFSNFHTHTVFSDGRDTPEEMIRAAIGLGMPCIGFSDHSTTAFDDTYCIPQREYPAYLHALRALRERYRDRIEVLIGLEYDVYADPVRRDELDYLLGDCHYVETSTGYHSVDHAQDMQADAIRNEFGGDTLAYARSYYSGYTEGIGKIRPDVLGHFDLCAKFGFMDEDDPRYRSYALEALCACLEVCPRFEVNTGAIARGLRNVPYPAPWLLREALVHGARPVFGSDAHRTEHLAFAFREAAELLRSVGFRSVLSLRGGKWEEDPL